MNDSARIQEEDMAYKQKRHRQEGRRSKHGYKPLYTTDDAKKAATFMQPIEYGRTTELDGHRSVCFHEAGHISGFSHASDRVE